MDGRGVYQEKTNQKKLEIEIKVRQDSQIPDFDSIVGLHVVHDDFSEQAKETSFMIDMFENSGMGVFVDDVMKMSDFDFLSEFDSSIDRLSAYTVYILRALKSAILDYLKGTISIEANPHPSLTFWHLQWDLKVISMKKVISNGILLNEPECRHESNIL